MPDRTDEIRAGVYHLGAELARGGSSVVYEATDAAGHGVAIKTLFDAYGHVPGLAEGFLAEAKIVMHVAHPHVARAFDAGMMSDGRAYIAMERLIGETLEQDLAHAGRWSEGHVLELGRQLAGALAAAHAVGIIHRDVRPENVFLHRPVRAADDAGPDVVTKLLDFGRAKQDAGIGAPTVVQPGGPLSATTTALRRTSSAYAAPEYLDVDAAAIDHRVDIFALGITLYEAATGRVPDVAIRGRTAAAEAVSLPGGNRTSAPSVAMPPSRALLEIIDRAIAPDRRRRFATMDELRVAIEAVQAERSAGPRPASVQSLPAVPGMSPHKLKLALWVAGILATLVAITGGIRCAVGS